MRKLKIIHAFCCHNYSLLDELQLCAESGLVASDSGRVAICSGSLSISPSVPVHNDELVTVSDAEIIIIVNLTFTSPFGSTIMWHYA
jgi:hypothetical protein